eukprot:gene30197-39398_t
MSTPLFNRFGAVRSGLTMLSKARVKSKCNSGSNDRSAKAVSWGGGVGIKVGHKHWDVKLKEFSVPSLPALV